MKHVSALAGVALALTVAVGATLPVAAQEKLTYNMAWLPQGSSVGVAVAIDRGWFKEAGLDVSMMRGYGGNRTANELDQGQYEIGYVDPVRLALNRANGGKIRLVGAINTHWPAGICYIEKNGEKKNLDAMKGLQLGGGSASPVHNIVPAWLEANGKPKDFIRLLRLDPAVVDASLVEGKIDLAECWRASNRPVILKQAKIAGVNIGWIEYSDYGLNAYGSGFAASEDMIAKKPDVIRKFLKASYRGFDFARANPDQAADMMVKMFPALDRTVVLDQIKDINDLIVDKSTDGRGLGYLRDDRIQSTMQFIDKSFDLKGKVKAADIYTNALLD